MQAHKLSGQIAVQDLARRIAALPTGGGWWPWPAYRPVASLCLPVPSSER